MKYEVYHGRQSSSPEFNLNYVGKGGEPTDDQYGPGFYFTDMEREAARYSAVGGIVIHANIEINNPLTDNTMLTKKQVTYMIRNAPEIAKIFDAKGRDAKIDAFYETKTLSNIAEHFKDAYNQAVDMRVGNPSLDHMLYIWNEHYSDDSDQYLKNLTALGYDGIIVPSEANLFVVFSPAQIKVLDVRKVEDNAMTESIRKFIKTLKRDDNASIVESILKGFDVIFESYDDYDEESDEELHITAYIDRMTSFGILDGSIDGSTVTKMYYSENPTITYMRDKNPEDYVYIEWIDTEEKHRGKGYAGKLVDHLINKFPNKTVIADANSLSSSIMAKSGVVNINESNNAIVGGKADTMTLCDIAEKHGVDASQIQCELEMGVKVEMEHTDDPEAAIEIAMDHLVEIADYYTRLDKMESEAGVMHEAVAYKVMAVANGKLVSGSDSRQTFGLELGPISMSGNGIYMAPDKQYVLDYYSGLADNEVLLTFEFNPEDITTGDLSDKEPEISVPTATITNIQMLDEGSIMEGGNPMRPKRTLNLDKSDHKTQVMFGILSSFRGMSDRNKARFMNNHVPKGFEIAIHSLSKLSESELIRMKENARDIRDEEKDLSNSEKNQRRTIRERKQYEREMGKYNKQMTKEGNESKNQSTFEKQKMIDQRIQSGELDVDELKRMREDGEIDDDNQLIDINAPDKSITSGVKKIGKGFSELKNAFTRKNKAK